MAGDAPPPSPRNRGLAAAGSVGNVVVGAPESAVFSILGRFVPKTAVTSKLKFQHLLTAKFLADAGKDSVKYAALVTVVSLGSSAFASSLIALATLIPSIAFGLYGGAISDSLPKRIALFIAYGVNAALCLVSAFFFEDTTLMLFTLVFLVWTLSQISSPAEQTLVPLVTSERELAAANSVMGMSSSFGTAFGSAFIAPILLLAFSADAVFLMAGLFMLGAMTRLVYLDSPGDLKRAEFIKPKANYSGAIKWLGENPSIGTMVAISAIAGMSYTILSTFAPTYVADVLEIDPAKTVFVMGSAGVGMALSLLAVPYLINRFGERKVAASGFVLLIVSLVGLGLINSGAVDFLQIINPVHWVVEIFNLELTEETQLAVFISFPVGMGAGVTDNSVKTYLNRRVPVVYQGRTFAMRNLSESALTIPPLFAVSALVSWLGISAALVLMPLVLYGLTMALLRWSWTLSDNKDEPHHGVLDTYWEAPEDAEITAMEDDGVSTGGPPLAQGPAPGA